MMNQPSPEASQGFVETVGSAVCASEPANAMDYACCAKVGPVTTEIQPRQAEVVTVMEGAVRECPRLESPQEHHCAMDIPRCQVLQDARTCPSAREVRLQAPGARRRGRAW